MDKIKQWFASLQPRERITVTIAAVLVSLMVIYVLGLAPFYRTVAALDENVTARKADVAWMMQNAAKVQMMAANQPQAGASNESMVVLVARTAREVGLGSSLTNQTPSGANGIRVNLQDAAFDMLMVWLSGLQVSQGITVQSATINRAAQPGLVNVSLELNRAGG
jgi:general secretion pathway protein M